MILLAKNVNKTVNKPEESNSEMVNRRRDNVLQRKQQCLYYSIDIPGLVYIIEKNISKR